MANTNRFPGLARGPIDHKSSSVINQISNATIDMGAVVVLTNTIFSGETLPRVEQTTTPGNVRVYGIVVGGDVDGIYGNGSSSVDDSTRASNAAGQGVVVVTQGRCLARVTGGGASTVSIGDKLSTSGQTGELRFASPGDTVIAIALDNVASGSDVDMIAIDVQRGGISD